MNKYLPPAQINVERRVCECVCVCVYGEVSMGVGGREGVLALSCLRIWLGIRAYSDIHGIIAARLLPGRHSIVVRITARTKQDLPE
jgi:hypothetical protein